MIKLIISTTSLLVLFFFSANNASAAYGPAYFGIVHTPNSIIMGSYPNQKVINHFYKADGSQLSFIEIVPQTPTTYTLPTGTVSTEIEVGSAIGAFAILKTINSSPFCQNLYINISAQGVTNPRGGYQIQNYGNYNLKFSENNVTWSDLPPGGGVVSPQMVSGQFYIGYGIPGQQFITCVHDKFNLSPEWLGLSNTWSSPTIDMQPIGIWNRGQTESMNIMTSTDKTTTVNLSSELCSPALNFSPSSYTVPANSWPHTQSVSVTIPLGTLGTCRVKATGTYNGQGYPDQTLTVEVKP